jgi:WD40 repeat protein
MGRWNIGHARSLLLSRFGSEHSFAVRHLDALNRAPQCPAAAVLRLLADFASRYLNGPLVLPQGGDAETLKQIAILQGHSGEVGSAVFSPDARRVVTPRTARIWDAESFGRIAVLEGHGDELWNATFSPGGDRVVIASRDHTERIWAIRPYGRMALLKGHDKYVVGGNFSPDGKRVETASWDKTARIWDAETHKQIAVPEGHAGGALVR